MFKGVKIKQFFKKKNNIYNKYYVFIFISHIKLTER